MNISVKLDSHAVWDGPMINIIGKIIFFIGLILIIPSLTAVIYNESVSPFIYPAIACFIISIPMFTLFRLSKNMRSSEGLLIIILAWILVIGIGLVPFVMLGMDPVDALFESTSGFTTTGSTILTTFDDQPYSILLWRAVSHWVGGIAVILIFTAMLPLLGIGGRAVSPNETYGSGSKNFSARIKDVGREFAQIYVAFTLVLLVLCVLLGVDVFDSLCIALSTIATGGFLPTMSLGDYSIAVQLLVMVFMFLGGTNFYLHYRAIYKREVSGYVRNTEFKTMLVWYIIASVVIFAILIGLTGEPKQIDSTLEGYKDVLFTVISLGTTTGFATVDYGLWTSVSVLGLLVIIMFLGGSAGSTAGGVKINRAVLVFKYLRTAVLKIIHPRAIFDVKMDGNSVGNDSVSSAVAIVMLFGITALAGTIIAMMFGIDGADAISMVVSSISNAGPGFGTEYGPFGSFAALPASLKVVLSVIMWLGRLEIVMALVIVTPSFWKEISRAKTKKISKY